MRPITPRKFKVKAMVDEIVRNSEVGTEHTSFSVLNKIVEINPAYSNTIDIRSLICFIRAHPLLERGRMNENKIRVFVRKEDKEDGRRKDKPLTLQTERTQETTH